MQIAWVAGRTRGKALPFFWGRDMLHQAHRLRWPNGRSPAVTLVELLVAISIISLLLSALTPSLKAARSRAQSVVCAARLRQWGVAVQCYAADNGGLFPHCDGLDRSPAAVDDPAISAEDLADWHGWVDVLPAMIGHKPWRQHVRRAYPQSDTFFQCPTAKLAAADTAYGYWPKIDGYFSYAMNACLELDRNAWRPPDGKDWPMPSFLSSSRINGPQRVVLLFDQLLDPAKGYGGRFPYREAGKYCGSYPIAFSARHARRPGQLGGNILFCDGHAEWQATVWQPEWTHWQIGRQQGPPRNDRNWYPYPAR